MAQTKHNHFKRRKRITVKKYWTKSKTETQKGKHASHVSCQSTLQITNSFSLLTVHTSLSWAGSMPVFSFPCQTSQDSDISNTMQSPSSQLCKRPRWACNTHLALKTFLSHSWRFHNSFLMSLTLKLEPCGWSFQVLLFDGAPTRKHLFQHLCHTS